MPFLAIRQLHVEFFKAAFCRHSSLLQILQAQVNFRHVAGNLLGTRACLFRPLRKTKCFYLKFMRFGLSL